MYLEVHRPLSAANDTTLLHLLDPFGICSQSGLCIYLCVFIISVFVCVYLLLRYTGQCLLQTFPLCCILLTYFDQDFCNGDDDDTKDNEDGNNNDKYDGDDDNRESLLEIADFCTR